jgi:uncharacterized glyoxalase superfamily protein PhnB
MTDTEGATMSTQVSLMLAVEDAATASAWYQEALGATELWSLGSVRGLTLDGAPFFLHESTASFVSPQASGTTTVRVEVFVDDPDALLRRAAEARAEGAAEGVREHAMPWGVHRQGSFRDPFGHVWHVGDRTPLEPFPAGGATDAR